jgi:Putative prokaryotic signal transducing protein
MLNEQLMLDEQLVPVFSTTSFTEAEILRNVIKEEGIPCELDNQNQAGLTGILEIKGLVMTSHEVRAKLLLSKYEKQRSGDALEV